MNVIIVHGSPSRNEKSMDFKTRIFDKHWMPWLKSRLEERGIKATIPLMPEPWEPHYQEWKREFEKLAINKDTILIGHSSGGGFLVRWLGDTQKKIRKLILVAPAIIHSGEWKPLEDLLRFEINKKVKDNVGKIIIFVSDNDTDGIKKSVEIFHKSLGGRVIELKNQGHFTLDDMRTEEFPELLNEVLDNK